MMKLLDSFFSKEIIGFGTKNFKVSFNSAVVKL